MSLRLHKTPWAHFCGAAGWELNRDAGRLQVDATLSMRLVGDDSYLVRVNGRQVVACSGAGRRASAQYAFAVSDLPGSQSLWSCVCDGKRIEIATSGLPARLVRAERDNDPREQWLLWQSSCYLKLSDHALDAQLHALLDDPQQGETRPEHRRAFSGDAGLPRGGARRRWETVRERWQESQDSVAIMSLVAQLARRKTLLQALRSIAGNPRRMLLRGHSPRKVHEVREMDMTTMRAFARAPGRTAVQKAGSKQELLAVVREETVDLPENRVVLWVAERLQAMTAAWMVRYGQRASLVVGNVGKAVLELRRLAESVLRSGEMNGVKPLAHHLQSPTYCLQFDRRYRQVWQAYREIRTQDRRRDDAFRWQGQLWGTTARLLLVSLLLDPKGAGWSEAHGHSTPYFRGDPVDGEWLEGPSTPGPFKTSGGLCHLVDLRRPLEESTLSPSLLPVEALDTGGDLLLVWPEVHRMCVVWSTIAAHADSRVIGVGELSQKFRSLRGRGDWTWSGLVMQAEPYVSTQAPLDWVDQYDSLVVMHVPEDVFSRWGDMQACIQLMSEEALR